MAFEYNVWSNVPSLIPTAPVVSQPVATSRSASPPTSGGSTQFTLRHGGHHSIHDISFGEGRLASTSDNTVVIWNLNDWRPMRTLSGRRGSRYESLAWDPKQLANRLATLSPNDRAVKIWDLRAKSEHQLEFQANVDAPSGLIWNPDGSSVIIGSSTSLTVYDVRQNRQMSSKKFDHSIYDFTFFNGHLAVGTSKGTVEFLDQALMACKFTLLAHMTEVTALGINPKVANQLATGGNDALIQMWKVDKDDFVCAAAIDRPISRINKIAFSGNGKWIASSSQGEKSIDVASAETGEVVVSLPNDNAVRTICFDRGETETAILAYCLEHSREVYVQPVFEVATTTAATPSTAPGKNVSI